MAEEKPRGRDRHGAVRVRARAPRSTCSRTSASTASTTCRSCSCPDSSSCGESSREDINRVALGIDVRERAFLRRLPATCSTSSAARAPVEMLLPRRQRRRAGAALQRDAPAASRGRGRHGRRRHSPRARGASRPARARRPHRSTRARFTVHELRAALHARLRGLRRAGRHDGARWCRSATSTGCRPTPTWRSTCRFLPNPFFVEELRPKTGLEPAVAATCWSAPRRKEFLKHTQSLLAFTLPRYQREGKSYLTIAVGCTGGRHRSVVLVEEFGRRLVAAGYRVQVRHRDIAR